MLSRMLRTTVLIALAASAQPPTFDVATIKPEPPVPPGEYYTANLGRIEHGELTMANVTLSEAVRFAWGINNDAQVAGPEWIKSKEIRYQIHAKTSPDTSRDRVRRMLQTLLMERLRLKTHTEQRELAHLELSRSSKPLKIQPLTEGSDASQNKNWMGHIVSNGMSMEVLTTILSRFLRQPILDNTGLEGRYALDLTWAPEPRGNEPADAPPGPSIYSAVQEQLGLKLEAKKSAVPVVVVDYAERIPIGN
jgi:uncharacterized protein (TIGR03435 family)